MKVAIVGLGPAGLRAALALKDAGIEAHLFEARSRVGGRLRTIRDDHGLHYEAGGEWIDGDHDRILALLARFNQQPVESDQRPGKVLFQGDFVGEDAVWADAQGDEAAFEEAADHHCLDLEPTPWDNLIYANLDQANLGDFIRSNARSVRGKWWLNAVYRSDEGEDPDRVSLLSWLCGYMNYQERDPLVMSKYRFPEGAQGFCERMLAETGLEPQLSNPLKKVTWSPDSVLLTFEKGAIAVDQVILAIPPFALRNIEFDPYLPESTWEAISNAPMSRTVKMALFFKEKFWLKDGWKGRLYSDMRIHQFWDGSLGDAPVLNCYVCGTDAASLSDDPNAVENAVRELANVFPEAAELFIGGTLHDWIKDPYAGGGFPYSPPGFVLENLQDLRLPIGPIHFAGDHSANWAGFIEGALESGERAAGEVLLKRNPVEP